MKIFLNPRTKYYNIYIGTIQYRNINASYYLTSSLKENPLEKKLTTSYLQINEVFFNDVIPDNNIYIGYLRYDNINYTPIIYKVIELFQFINKDDKHIINLFNNFYDKYNINNCLFKIKNCYRKYKLNKYVISRFPILLLKHKILIDIKYYPKYGIFYNQAKSEWNKLTE